MTHDIELDELTKGYLYRIRQENGVCYRPPIRQLEDTFLSALEEPGPTVPDPIRLGNLPTGTPYNDLSHKGLSARYVHSFSMPKLP